MVEKSVQRGITMRKISVRRSQGEGEIKLDIIRKYEKGSE